MYSLETRSSNNLLAFLWALIVLLYWQTYSYFHVRQILFKKCYGIIKKIAVSFNHTYMRYIDEVLSINKHNFDNYVDLIYPNEREIKDTTKSGKFDSYLHISLNIDSNCILTASLCVKREDFDFAIVNFPFLCSDILLSPAYGVYISQLIRCVRACFAYEGFSKRGKLLIKMLMLQGYNESH
jgi:hypothetical protein